MDGAAGEESNAVLRVTFDPRLKLGFHGSKVTSDAGLLAFRELDDALGLMEVAGEALADTRTGRNSRHTLMAQLQQSIFGRLAGYEDVNDADRLAHDPALRWIVGGRAVTQTAASTSQMGRFETEVLTQEANLSALTDLSGRWIERVHARRPVKGIVLDMDSSVSPTFGEQEGSAYNGHFGCTCYHPLFVFNQFGDVERCTLRSGNVRSAAGWRNVLEPVVARYRTTLKRRYFRADAAFASPEVYAFLEAEDYGYVIRLPANAVLQRRIVHLLKRPVGRPPQEVRASTPASAIKPRPGAGHAGSWPRSRMAPRRTLPTGGLPGHEPVPSARAGGGLLQWAGHGGAVDPRGQARGPLDAPVLPLDEGQRGSAPASCTGL
jgi:Transposase DDE domain group 1